jgi:hypothetical protein
MPTVLPSPSLKTHTTVKFPCALIKCDAMKTYGGVEVYLHAFVLDRMLDWPQNQSGRNGQEEHFFLLPGIKPHLLDRSIS